MGRRRITQYNVQGKKKTRNLNSEAIKDRHRNADSKYRQTVQKLYDLLRKTLNETAAKDNLLNTVLDYIKHVEKEIFDVIGSAEYLECKQRFMTLLCYEEAEWKREKDLYKWWSNMQEFLKKKIQASDASLQDDAKHYISSNEKLEKLEMSYTPHVISEAYLDKIVIPPKQHISPEKDKGNSLLYHCNGSSPYENTFPVKLGMESLATECVEFGDEHFIALEIPMASPVSKLTESDFADNDELQSSSTLLFL